MLIQCVPNLPEQRLVPFLLFPVLIKCEPNSLQSLFCLFPCVSHNICCRDGILDEPDPGTATGKEKGSELTSFFLTPVKNKEKEEENRPRGKR